MCELWTPSLSFVSSSYRNIVIKLLISISNMNSFLSLSTLFYTKLKHIVIFVLTDNPSHPSQRSSSRQYSSPSSPIYWQSKLRTSFVASIFINSLIKLSILPLQKDSSLLLQLIQIVVIVCSEHLLFVLTIFLLLWLTLFAHLSFLSNYKLWCQLYLALTLPDLGKIFALILQTWDNDPLLYLLMAIVIFSIQYHTYSLILFYYIDDSSPSRSSTHRHHPHTTLFSWKLLLLFLLGYVVKFFFRFCFVYSLADIYQLGVFL